MAIWIILLVALGSTVAPAAVWAYLRRPARTPRRVGVVNAAIFSIVPISVALPLVRASHAARAATYYATVAAAEKNAAGPYDASALLISNFDYAESLIAAPVIGVVAAGIHVWIHNKRWNRLVRGSRCRSCGYDLTGNASGRCPECGEGIENANNVEEETTRRVGRL